MEEMTTPISQEAWRNLRRGDSIIDSEEEVWVILATNLKKNPDILLARSPDGDLIELKWCNDQIFELDEWAFIAELNNSSVSLEIV